MILIQDKHYIYTLTPEVRAALKKNMWISDYKWHGRERLREKKLLTAAQTFGIFLQLKKKTTTHQTLLRNVIHALVFIFNVMFLVKREKKQNPQKRV